MATAKKKTKKYHYTKKTGRPIGATKPELPIPAGYLSPKGLARRWGVALTTLANWRCNGKGPKFEKRPHLIIYPIASVERYESKGHR